MPVHCKRRNYASLCGLAPMLATRSPLDTGLRICSCITVCHCTSSGSAGHAMKVVAVAACTEPRRLRLVGNHQLINVGCASWGSWSSSTSLLRIYNAYWHYAEGDAAPQAAHMHTRQQHDETVFATKAAPVHVTTAPRLSSLTAVKRACRSG
jgi:hypothetical protein